MFRGNRNEIFEKTACSIIYNRYQFVKIDNRTQMARRTSFYV